MQDRMFHIHLLSALCVAVALPFGGAYRARVRHAGLRGVGGSIPAAGESQAAAVGVQEDDARAAPSDLDQVVDAMLGVNSSHRHGSQRPSNPNERELDIEEVIHEGASKMDLDTAVQGVRAAQPPPEVLAVLSRFGAASNESRGSAGGTSAAAASHASADEDAKKAVTLLNDMIVKAQERLGNKSIECTEFHEDSERDMQRMRSELSKMGMERANLNRQMIASMGAIQAATQHAQSAKERLRTQEIHFREQLAQDKSELEVRTKDLEEATFMLDLTECSSLLQVSGAGATAEGGVKSNGSQGTVSVRICENTTGISEIYFKDTRLANVSSGLSAEGQRMLYSAMADAQQVREGQGLDSAGEGMQLLVAGTSSRQLARGPGKAPLDTDKQSKKCIQSESGCGPLHDTMGALWASMKELVDYTKQQVFDDNDAFKHFTESINNEVQSISNGVKEQQTVLQAATTASGTLGSHQAELQSALENLERMSWNKHQECKQTIREILYKQICAIHKVRDELIKLHLKDVDLAEVTDCYVTDFSPGSCSKNCDDELLGGEQNLTRDIITKNNEYGAPCPALHTTRHCNRKKCPVDCKVSEWSSWSKCTADCGGGIQSRTRKLEQKPKNDGQACNTLQEAQVCNTGACDRDCSLGEWSDWSACDMACNSGFRQRTREVEVLARGRGVCPKEDDDARVERKTCNTQACHGDETCFGLLDVVLLIDSSGSLGEEGFKAVKSFAGNIVQRFIPEAYGNDGAQVGAVLFGNGNIDKDKVMSDATVLSGLSTDMQKVKEKIEAVEWQKGMTNMAQAIFKARSVLKTAARMSAQSLVILITDGRMAFKTQVAKAVEDIRESARMMVVHIQSHPMEDYVKLLHGFASRPWMTNYMLVRGRDLLNADPGGFASDVIARACKKIESPSARKAESETEGYQLVLQDFSCGDGVRSSMQKSPADCIKAADLASPDWKAFAFGGKPGPAPGTIVKPGAVLSADDTPFFVYSCQVYTEECTKETAHRNLTYNVYKRIELKTDELLPY